MPEPLLPSTPTRSPNQISVSNGCISWPPSTRSSSRVATTARLAVRPPVSRMDTFWRNGTASGGPASSNLRSRVSAACRREAIPSL